MSIIPPNHTIYVQNINDQIKLQTRRDMLHLLFSKCGEVVDIMTRPGAKYRGQAWVIYKDIADATRALQQLNHTMFYGKQLRLFFAKTKSDIISKADGSYIPPEARLRTTVVQSPNSDIATPYADASHPTDRKRPLEEEVMGEAVDGDDLTAPSTKIPRSHDDTTPSDPIVTLTPSIDHEQQQQPKADTAAVTTAPRRWLLATGFPSGVDTTMLHTFFKDTPGFLHVGLTNNKQQAILEFETVEEAGSCISTMNRYRFDLSHRLKLEYLDRS